ncbi:putative phosphatase YieH [Pseudomonas savastanoi pv. glycinea]|uniref:HAD-IA family hydrolase n=1 Tax=Pseudomonas phytophila TaxID=2867264 RepID=A0ABY6FKF0_9PSED|nr:HAD-IA family hydrolase [Pseudomonas phytophila]RMQ96461.1 putative phosphatase YieH [Pseudomonas savastanoi pv. glycinea]UXZ98124.1 HAD-IA family hydrolase [Pseudomonas phytophila]
MSVKGIIFDNDGTLVDSERVAATLLHQMLSEHNIQLSVAEVLDRYRGVQFELFMADIKTQAPGLNVDRFVQSFREASLHMFQAGLNAMPGAVDFVKALKLPGCVTSNGPPSKIETTLKAAGLYPWFEGRLISAYDVGSWKPEPGLILAGCDFLDLPPENCLLVEDSHAGVQAGLAAGTKVVGYGLDTDFSVYVGRPDFYLARHYRDLAHLLTRI